MTTTLQGRPTPTTPGLSYWAIHYRDAEFYRDGLHFSDYAPAFYVGISAHLEHPDRDFDDPLLDLSERYQRIRLGSALDWEHAQDAARSAWERARSNAQAARQYFQRRVAELVARA
ncbi:MULTISPECIES: hypothetical protein [Lysobacter]|jgi:hypothetical protein|uniref:Uncharacterized protein n=1 Tax=Lysobacter gummosus TaxID=262324 RepID=A0ABY3X847_9GAMM|nr:MULTISPECIES: hypothetical protein [Lysobacter]ALN91979.1 hypothetical protein LG3211_3017 [Lysobacter gummosus]MBT2746843.1 hypothetical protein [Lysobacter sp. ISL-42]MBT2750672.1 hypothetical protein [Lysobacter sp. ISL-50]MBT2779501.1 hypothetical protein [Lysobacter sp. ISL-54]MBT2784645.1 hypothetical protein [Lysobacter sp. ISL-52]